MCAFPGEGSRHRNSQASSQGAGAEPGCGGGWRPRGGHVRVTWPGPGGLREQEEDGSEGCSDRGGQSGARPVPLAPLESLPGPLLWPAHPRTTPPTALLLPPVVPRMGPQEQPGVQGALGHPFPGAWRAFCCPVSHFSRRSVGSRGSPPRACGRRACCLSREAPGGFPEPGAPLCLRVLGVLPWGLRHVPSVPRGCLGRVRLSTAMCKAHVPGDGRACGRGAPAAARLSVREAPDLAA